MLNIGEHINAAWLIQNLMTHVRIDDFANIFNALTIGVLGVPGLGLLLLLKWVLA